MKNSGWIILDKPKEMTSRAAGGKVARMFGAKKFGHLGTLDPMASGVLPIALGEATKMIPYLEELWKNPRFDENGCETGEKEYAFSIEWGIETDTLDVTGKIVKRDDRRPDYKEIDRVCDNYIGEIEQIPPAYSAIHIGGRRAYELARAGVELKLPPRKITIYDLILGRADSLQDMKFSTFLVNCSVGTYVRSLARDIGRMAGDYLATVDMIRRTRTHGFDIKDAKSLDFLENLYNNGPKSAADFLKPIDFGLDDILVAELNSDDAKLFQNGGAVATKDNNVGLRRVYSDGKFIGIGLNDNYALCPKRIIKE
ncbi:MAG: tRNA pseudouridine(55) synthase TruB [Rickettsiales bacterium]|jgi:tRNA pseudouridine55 synthase|nr:tRNA pseudouridine(55) synthase TruB [Rickettsiales bacterium]